VLFVAALFIGFVTAETVTGKLPSTVLMLVISASIASFFLYAVDKMLAQSRQWRIPGLVLHLLDLFGGWPGAVVAQSWFRHKTKASVFRVFFWLIVAVNIGAVAWLTTTAGNEVLRAW
jgi:uncharacterized membrane protein YsdA (DUF1294 family)